MKNIIIIIIGLCMIPLVHSAIWVDDFADCPTTYIADCLVDGERVCGYDAGETPALECAAPGEIIEPSSGTISSSNVDDGSFNGGYIIDCTDYDAGGNAVYCDNDASYWCDYNTACYNSPVYRNTNCTGWGTYVCSFSCRSGYQYCTDLDTTGVSYTENCNVDTDSSDCSVLGAYSSTHTNVGDACACECDGGWQVCTGLGSVGDPEDGCSIDLGNDGCNQIPGGTYSDIHTDAQSDCGCDCVSGWGYCSGEGISMDYDDRQVDGCPIEVNDLGSCSTLNATYNDINNDVNSGCSCTCDTGYINCTANATIGYDGFGCGVDYGTTTDVVFGWSGVNTVVDASCVSSCESGYLDCDSDYTGTGCEVQNAGNCTLPSTTIEGTYNGCTCEVDPVDLATSGNETIWSGSQPFLWLTQLGGGWVGLFNASNGSFAGFDENACVVLQDGTSLCDSTDVGGSTDFTGYWTSNDNITQHAGTDVSTDLEEESHCTEHDGNYLTCDGEELDVQESAWWNADGDVSADEISESKIAFSTACAAGNHYYLSGNDLACEADDDTTYSAGDGLDLGGTTFSIDTSDFAGAYVTGEDLNIDASGACAANTLCGGGHGHVETDISDADWWDADGDVVADEISESKIAFSTACAAGNHYYLSGNDLACEADDDTTYSAGGTLLDLTGTTFSINEGTLTDEKWCQYELTGTQIECNVEPVVNTNTQLSDEQVIDAINESGGVFDIGINATNYINWENITYFPINMSSGEWGCEYTNGSGWTLEKRPCDL